MGVQLAKFFMKKIVVSCIWLVVLVCLGFAEDLSGIVIDENGKPIAKVLVYSYPAPLPPPEELSPYQYTDSQGYFKFRHSGKVLFFVCNGFRPKIHIPTLNDKHIRITLENAGKSEWVIPSCQLFAEKSRYVGAEVRVQVPTDIDISKEKSHNLANLTIKHDDSNGANYLTILGSVSGGDFPNQNLILSSVDLFSRSLKNNNKYGVEFRGKLQDGGHWRQVSFGFYTLIYRNASSEASHFFDKIIDSLCVE